jgi:hypothetical protein
MELIDLTVNQLKRAAAIKEQIDVLNKELGSIFGASATSRAVSRKRRSMSAAGRKNIAAAQKARWAKVQADNPATAPAAVANTKTMSRATKAKLSAKLKAYWRAKKAGKK